MTLEHTNNERQKMFKKVLLASLIAIPLVTVAEDVPIMGTVTSKCVIYTETPGVYGNPTPGVLSTAVADGGVQPIIRYDVVQSGFYKAVITVPSSFTSSPALSDVVRWTGGVDVSRVTDAAMSTMTWLVYGLSTVVVSFYFLLDGRNMKERVIHIFPKRYYLMLTVLTTDIDLSLQMFFRGQIVLGLLFGLFMIAVCGA